MYVCLFVVCVGAYVHVCICVRGCRWVFVCMKGVSLRICSMYICVSHVMKFVREQKFMDSFRMHHINIHT